MFMDIWSLRGKRRLECFDVAFAVFEVAVEAVKNTYSGFAVDGAELGLGLRCPEGMDALRLDWIHFFRPNRRRMSSWGTPSPRSR